MTVAVIIATRRAGAGPGPAAALPYRDGPEGVTTLLSRLCDRLAALNVPDVQVIGRPGPAPLLRADGHFVTESPGVAGDLRELARLARVAEGPLVVLPGDLVAGDGLLGRFVATGALVAAVTVPPVPEGVYGTAGVRVERGRVVHAGPGAGEPNAAFPGLLRFELSQAAVVADEAEALADAAEELADEMGGGETGDSGEVAEVLLAGLVHAGVRVDACPSRGAVCRRAAGEDQVREARTALETVGDDRERLAAAVKSEDGFFATFAVSSYSPYIVRWVAGRGVAPNTVTAVSMALALLAAMWFTVGTRAGMVTGAVLLYLAFVLDCVDGQLARYTGRISALGGWLDAMSDRAKEYAVYAGLAIGSAAAATGGAVAGGDVWGPAAAAMILQTVRHMIDFSYRAHRPGEPGTAPDLEDPRAHRVARLSRRTSGVRPLHWAKKILVLPIGERFALIALTAALAGPRVTFLALLIWGGLATAYTLAGRTLRSVAA